MKKNSISPDLRTQTHANSAVFIIFPPKIITTTSLPLRHHPGDAAARAELHLATAVGPEPGAAAQQGGFANAALADDQQGLTFSKLLGKVSNYQP